MKSLSHVRLLATPWTAAYQAPPSMGFSRQENWSGVPLPSPRQLITQQKLTDASPLTLRSFPLHPTHLSNSQSTQLSFLCCKQVPTIYFTHAMVPHCSTLAWKIPWMEETGRLQSMGLLESDTTERLHFHFSLSCIGEGNGNPLQCSCLENPRDRGAWWAAIYGVAQSRTRLK